MKGFFASLIMMSGFSLLSGCGPLYNSAPSKAEPVADSLSKPVAQNSKSGQFLIFKSSVQSSTVPDPVAVQLGENTYLIRLVRANDLRQTSALASIKIIYSMPAMPDMGQFETNATRNADGSFNAVLDLSMSGVWNVAFSMSDAELQDEYAFSVQL